MSTAQHPQPALSVDITPISGSLGLADLAVRADGPLSRVSARVWRVGSPAAAVPVALGSSPASAGAVFRARVWVGEAPAGDRIVYELEAITPSGDRIVSGLVEAGIEPPAALRTPDWAKGAVWYQIFPERFCNGSPDNDPAGPDVFGPGWDSPWEHVSTAEQEAARARAMAHPRGHLPSPAREGAALSHVMDARRYGGDLQGVLARIDHLKALGVTGVYLTPVFRARSAHKYEAADFRHIDETFACVGHTGGLHPGVDFLWTNPEETLDPSTWKWTEADRFVLDQFLPTAKAAGLRVLFDGVFNHSGKEHFAFQSILKDGAASPFASWYDAVFGTGREREESGVVHPPGTLLSWRGYGHRSSNLPCFRQTEDRDLHPGVKQHIFDITSRWLAPDGDATRGIDGWRLDVAADIGLAFWTPWREHVKAVKPEALLIGEVWFDAERFFGGRAFDGQMNYPLATALTAWLGREPNSSTLTLWKTLAEVFNHHPAVELVQMNLLTSHDTDRLSSMLHNPGRPYDQGAPPSDKAGGYDGGVPSAKAAQLAALGWSILGLLPGSPMIYQGEEWGMWGADDPHNRKPVCWPGDGLALKTWEGAPSTMMFESVSRVFRLRSHPAMGPVLRWGTFSSLPTPDPNLLCFERRLNNHRVVVLANRGDDRAALPPALVGKEPVLGGGVPGQIEARAVMVIDLGPGE